MPIAERNGGIGAITQWAFDEACRQYRAWDDAGVAPGVLAVNFSALHLAAAVNLDRSIAASLQRWRVPSSRMELELTESALIAASEIGDGTLDKLRQVGLHIALDDFGAGHSSLSYLATRPVNRLKIARQIVAGILTDPCKALVVRTAVRLARELGIELPAAGVETSVQASALAALGCDQAEGSYFGEPATAARAAELLRDGRIAVATARTPQIVTVA
jgi:EAL domain-containing protein (putative c-di-GMP-specific phosphodiesterase class I)